MKRLLVMVCAVGLLAGQSLAQEAADGPGGPDCATAQACIDILRTYRIAPAPPPGAPISTSLDAAPIARAVERLAALGDGGVVALLPLLEDPNPYASARASYVLRRFDVIAPRHAAALIKARERGVGWLEIPLARTGTDEALAYLWADFQARPEPVGQTVAAIREFGARAWPRIRTGLEACRDGTETARCAAYNRLIGWPELPAFAAAILEETARSPRLSEPVRNEAVELLITRTQPYGLTVLMQRLEPFLAAAQAASKPALGFNRSRPQGDNAYSTLWAIGRFGPAAVDVGPRLIPLLEARGMPESRAAAARALGQIGYRGAIPALIAQQADFEDDWGFAYEVVEALGRLGGGKELLQAVARDYWFEPVRFNAQRGLNLMAGGKFERPGVPGDGDPLDGSISGSFQLRYMGDDPPDFDVARARCPAKGDRVGYDQVNPGRLKWPDRRAPGPVEIGFLRPAPEEYEPLLAKHPDFKLPRTRPPTLMVRMGGHTLLGTDAGEFGGGVEVFGPDGKHHTLSYRNAWAAFPIEGGVLIVTESMSMGTGSLLVVKPGKAGPQIVRDIRLNSSPHRFMMAWPRTLIISARADHVAITQDAQGVLHLADAARLPVCAA